MIYYAVYQCYFMAIIYLFKNHDITLSSLAFKNDP